MKLVTVKNSVFALSMVAGSAAFAQVPAKKATKPAAAPAHKAELEAKPEAPKIELPTTASVTQQAGVGSDQAYGRTGVLELGGNLNFNSATNHTTFAARPTVGYFFMDNLELSAILGWQYDKVKAASVTATAHSFTILVEPSLHVPFNENMFGFVGAGVGFSAAKHAGAGAALAGRAGVNILVGRSGILSPEVNIQYASNRSISTPQGTLLAVNTTFGFGAGYTVMW